MRLKIFYMGFVDGIKQPLCLNRGRSWIHPIWANNTYDNGVNFGQRLINFLHGYGYNADWELRHKSRVGSSK